MRTRWRTDGLREFDAVAERAVGPDQVPGLVAVAACGDEVHVRTAGVLAIDGPAVQRDSIFRIASMAKPITAAATLVAADSGLFGIDDPVDRLLPELRDRRVLRRMDGPLDDTVPAVRPITIRDLLTFTCGFGAPGDTLSAAWPIVAAENAAHLATLGPPAPQEQPDPDTWIAALGRLPLLAQPGERWLYSTGASILGVLLARAAGEPFGEVLRHRVFEPLGMRDTAMWARDTGRLATGYRAAAAGLAVADTPDGAWSTAPAFGDGASGLVSTADDMLAFSRMLLRGGAPILSAASVHAMTTGQLTPEQRAKGGLVPDFFAHGSWGFGLSVSDSGAYGWDGGWGTSWLADPGRDLTVIVLTQRMFDSARTPQLHKDFQAAAYAALA
ncbi:CubicO group peptidase (beta-lactamase class C family) [Nocardia transvalensis]|uniref:CubicO group peptidase (Beta-lactamase class C family) n=1 Tax=Nocardia transvalensis TaxID=37333 RepID=A0A7W9PL51_9NOCA|nr:serine hydrolase domain-containing protein [Nocardia transvalensis]MBB5918057.1 CubicO group peptidase (beta-lactamase class C family) [Nocardia transvalensis]